MSGTDLEVLQPFDNQHQARPSCTVSGPKRKMTAGADTTYPMAKWPNLQRYANPHAEQQIITPHVKSQKGLPPKNKPDSDATTTKQSTAMDEVRGCPKSLEFIDDIINIDHSEQKVANYLGCRDSTQYATSA